MTKRILTISIAIIICSLQSYGQFGSLVNKAKDKAQSGVNNSKNNSNSNNSSNSNSSSGNTNSNNTITKPSTTTTSGSGSSGQINGKSVYTVESDIDMAYGFQYGHPARNGYFPSFSYSDYLVERDAYKKDSRAREPYLRHIAGADSFFDYKMPVLVAKEFDKLKKDLDQQEKGKENSAPYVSKQVKQIKDRIDYFANFVKPGSPMLTEFGTFKKKADDLSAWCDDYVKNGGFEAHKNKQKEEEFNKREFPKALSSNPTWEAAARTAVTNAAKSKGDIKILKTVTTTNMWQIKKNDIDIPTYRSQYVTVGYSQGGKCYSWIVQVSQAYAGGGTWNNGYSYSASDYNFELPCEKIH